MCRLYAFRANEPTKIECSLIYAQNALLNQSIIDIRGEPNADGWGISCYEDGVPRVEKRDTAAHQDTHFSLTAERLYARTVIAHIRQATVGNHSLPNTHPFTYGPWTFAHNGTLMGFRKLEDDLVAETDTDLLAVRYGDTDSELIFYWLLTRMRRVVDNGSIPVPDFKSTIKVLQESIAELDRRSKPYWTDEPSKLNFMLTNGHDVFATRLRNSLYYVTRAGIHDCEICGIPHVHHEDRTRYQAVIVASEPLSHEDWQEVPENTVIGVEEGLFVSLHPIG